MPIARLSDYRFAYNRERLSWRTRKKKVVVRVKGFAVEQHTDDKAFHLIFKKPEPEVGAAAKQISPIRKTFFQRSLRAIEELQTLDEKKLAEAVETPTDYSVLVSALKTEEALASIRTLRAKIDETSPPVLITEQGENGSQLEFPAF